MDIKALRLANAWQSDVDKQNHHGYTRVGYRLAPNCPLYGVRARKG